MIRASEVTGNLNEVAGFLADYTEKEGDLASKATSALIYPAIVIGVFIVVAFILVTFVFPQLGAVFAQNNVALPWYTQISADTGNFCRSGGRQSSLPSSCSASSPLIMSRHDEGKALIDDLKIRLPIVKKVYLPVVVARFGNAAALLVHGGIPIAQALGDHQPHGGEHALSRRDA